MLAHVAGFLKQIHICFRPRDSERAVPWKCVKRPAAPDPWLSSCERAANRLQFCRSCHQKQQRSQCHFLRWNNVESPTRSITPSESRSAYPRSVAPTCRTCPVPTLCKLSCTRLDLFHPSCMCVSLQSLILLVCRSAPVPYSVTVVITNEAA